MKQKLIYALTILLSIAYIIFGNRMMDLSFFKDDVFIEQFEKARIVSIDNYEVNELGYEGFEGRAETIIDFTARITAGELKGSMVSATQNLSPFLPTDYKEVEEGDLVMLVKTEIEDGSGPVERWDFAEYVRIDALIWLAVLFAICLIIFGRGKGFSTLIALVFTCLAVFAVFVPAILSGQNIYLWTVITCVFVVSVTLLLVNGASLLSLSAGLGCLCGVTSAGIITLIMDFIIKLTGYTDEHSVYITYLNPEKPIDLKAVVFAAIILGAVGAIMDVSVDIAAALREISVKVEGITFKELARSGINIGRDIIGTMASTLVLAYIGSSLCVVLLLAAYYITSLGYLFNREMIIVEILQALVGSFGILLAIPLTALISAALYTRKKKRHDHGLLD
jgi:uncharacterized membrane protein